MLLLLRIAVSAGMLGYLLSRFEVASVLPSHELSSLAWAALGVAVTGAALVLATVRWREVLRALDHRAELPALLSHYLAGTFVSNFLPTTVGGDVLRVTRLTASRGERPVAIASVMLERLTGFLVLPFLTLAALLGNPALRHLGQATRLALILSLGTLVALAVVLVVAGNPRVGSRLAGNASWLAFARAAHLVIERVRRHPADALPVLAASFAYQLTVVLAAWVAAHSLGLGLGWSAMMAFVPVVAVAQALPLSVNGLGLREGALVVLLAPLGVATGEAVALGLLLYGMNLLVSLLGAPAFAVGPRPVRVA